MEELIVKISQELLSISIGFVGLLFTSLSILMTIQSDKKENWKIASLKESPDYKKFISLNTNTAIGFILLFIFSIVILFSSKLSLFNDSFIYLLYGYIVYLICLVLCVAIIAYRYKQIIMLMIDNKKPTISE